MQLEYHDLQTLIPFHL